MIRYVAAAAVVALATAIPLAGAASDPATPQIVSSTPSSPANDNTPTLDGTADPGSLITVYTDSNCLLGVAGTGTADGSGVFHVAVTVPVPDDATTTFYATATDLTPAVSPCSSGFSYVEDSTAPDTTIQGPPPSLTSAAASFSFTGDDGSGSGVAGFECNLDGAGFSACTSPASPSGLDDGSHTFSVRAVDQAGNVDPSPDSFTWTVDATPPDTTIQGSPPILTDATASFAFSGSDGSGSGVAGFQCSIDGGGFSACTSPAGYTLASGSHTFSVRAVDQAGNVDPSPDSFTWTVDADPPATTISSSPPNPSPSASAAFTFNGSDPGGSVASFQCNLDGSGFSACASPASYSGLSDGPHTFAVRAVDQVGNLDPAPATRAWTIDTTPPPSPVITAAPSSPNGMTGATFSFTDAEPGVALLCRLDGGAAVGCSPGSVTYSGLADGSHTFGVTARDGLGNQSSPATYAWTIDTVHPLVTISDTPPLLTNRASATFAFASNRAGSTYECRLDGGSFGACTSPQLYRGLLDGSHTFAVRATSLGNVGLATAYTWRIDTVPPQTTITSGPPPNGRSASPRFTFTSSEPQSTFTCALDSGGYAPCTSPKTYARLADGAHTMHVEAVDAIGNADSSPAIWDWKITGGGGVVDVPPANVSRLKRTVGYGFLRLRWKSPADADFDHIGVYVSTSPKSPPRTLLYNGRVESYTIKKFKNGLYDRYLVVSYDHADNASRGASVVVPAGALLRSPLEGRAVRSVPVFRWAAVPKATFYNIQVYAHGRKILSAWPAKPRQRVTRSWRYAGHRFSFRKGVYTWYVWPGFGPRAMSHYGQLLGQGTFRVR